MLIPSLKEYRVIDYVHFRSVLKDIFTYEPDDLSTNIYAFFTYLNLVSKRHSIVFFISDCAYTCFYNSFMLTARNHYLTFIHVSDPS